MTKFRSRFLIVEDEEILAENLRDYLLRRDADVRTAANTEAALEELLRFRPTHVILDYSLPGANGLEAFSRLTEHSPELKCVLISGHPVERLRDAAAEAGIEHLLTKPFSFAELERVLIAWHSGEAGTPGDKDRTTAAPRRLRDRRRNPVEPQFPLNTADGWVLYDRRVCDRRITTGSNLAEFCNLALAPG
jgi:DNA-binding response OmpR family regulator